MIDAHNHLFGDPSPEEMLAVMDAVGVRTFVNVTGNVGMPLVDNCYTIERREFDSFLRDYVEPHPGRFAALTMSEFARWGDFTLPLRPGPGRQEFVDRAIEGLEADVAKKGALGLKVTKELGLQFRDESGAMVAVDDERLFPIWRRAGGVRPAGAYPRLGSSGLLPPDRRAQRALSQSARVPGVELLRLSLLER